jgi:hypothetical protein
MKTSKIIILILILTATATAQNYRIDWYVIGSGGGHSQSSNYQLDGTIGQPIVGSSSSSNYRIDGGFWVGAPAGPIGCSYTPGDINSNGSVNGVDIVYGVNYLKGTGPHPQIDCGGICPESSPFYAAGDVNGNCAFNGIDITYFVRYLKGQVSSLLSCPDCPPASMAPPAPAVEPIRAPVLKSNHGDKSPKIN